MANLNLTTSETSLIGGLGMTRVKVYDQQEAPDGKHSGCPHLHGICSEAYYVTGGKGYVELHNLERGFHTVELEVGGYFQFPPRTLHRLVNLGSLELLGIMSNAGLAENGDARIYFGREVDCDRDRYAAGVALVGKGLEGALERRDLAVSGYHSLMELWEADRDAYFKELKRFIEVHLDTVSKNQERFCQYIEQGPKKWATISQGLLEANTDVSPGPEISQLLSIENPRLGMCGLLQPVVSEGGY